MKFNKIEQDIVSELESEVLVLSKEYLKDQYINIVQQRTALKQSEIRYKELLDTEIDIKFLESKFIRVKSRGDK